jgi:hypothetical protein
MWTKLFENICNSPGSITDSNPPPPFIIILRQRSNQNCVFEKNKNVWRRNIIDCTSSCRLCVAFCRKRSKKAFVICILTEFYKTFSFYQILYTMVSLKLQIHYEIALNMPLQLKSILDSLPKHLARAQQQWRTQILPLQLRWPGQDFLFLPLSFPLCSQPCQPVCITSCIAVWMYAVIKKDGEILLIFKVIYDWIFLLQKKFANVWS